MKKFKSGTYQKHFTGTEAEYKTFLPESLFQDFTFEQKDSILLLEEANRLIGEINVYSKLIPDVDFFIAMHVNQEAVSSSKIEGTKTDIDEAILPKEEIDPERRDDWQEVQNYIKSMNYAISELENLPVSVRLIKQVHKILLSSGRGESKLPGEIRDSQNWIGGATVRTAHFVPPHKNELPNVLSDWEKFWHDSTLKIPVLVKVALLHYQFETIHPFLDGNGRTGRMLIALQLIERGFLEKPILYISNYIEKYRQDYYDKLDKVRTKNDWENWVRFFLEGVIISSKEGKKKFDDILRIKSNYEIKIEKLGKRITSARLLLFELYKKPIMSAYEVQSLLGVTYKSANSLVAELVRLKILYKKTESSRNRYFELRDYL